MTVNTNQLISMTEANQNFSRVARMADENGTVIIMKNNVPRYLLIEFRQTEDLAAAPDADVLSISKQLVEKNRKAYEELAK